MVGLALLANAYKKRGFKTADDYRAKNITPTNRNRTKKLNANYKFKSKTHEKWADFFNCFLIILVVVATFFAMIYSTIITTNTYIGNSDIILIQENVQDYYTSTDKYGKTRRYIEFLNPVDKEIITLEVYRQYNIGEMFEKQMKIGQWGILYSKE